MNARRPVQTVQVVGLLVLCAGLYLAAQGAWIPAKAWLAQQLIERAWEQRRSTLGHQLQAASGQRPQDPGFGRPWPWADTVPLARLHFDRLDRRLIVLAGDSGAVLAFGPGHRSASAAPGGAGNVVVSGHRDTHFALLREVQDGDRISVESARDAGLSDYQVVDRRVVRADDPIAVAAVLDDGGADRLTLVTCWPFDAVDPGTPWRYVVTARRLPDAPQAEEPAGEPGAAPQRLLARSAT